MSSKKKTRDDGDSPDAMAAVAVAVRTALALSSNKAPMRVTAMAAKAVEITAKQQQLTEEEEQTLRTRLQYRLYQQNHRAKKQRRMEELEHTVEALRLQVTALEEERAAKAKTLLQSAVKSLIGVFHGQQRSIEIVLQDLLGGGHHEQAQLYAQWKLLDANFLEWKLTAKDDVEFVLSRHTEAAVGFVGLCRLTLELRATEEQLATLFCVSNGHDDRHILGKLAATLPLSVPASAVVEVNAVGKILALSVDLDWTMVLMQLEIATMEQSARLGAACELHNIRICHDWVQDKWTDVAVNTDSQVRSREEPLRLVEGSTEEDDARDQRLSIDFLLG